VVSYAAFLLIQRRDSQANHTARRQVRKLEHVSIVRPHHDGKPEDVTLPGNISAWYEASIRAQVAGYVKSWSTDIGAVVKSGDILAEIDTPALDEKPAQAKEELNRVDAALELAKVTRERWAALRGASAVSGQSTEEKSSGEQVKEADVGVATANLERLKAQKRFAQIVAPFDGVVTVRDVDVGSYVAPDHKSQPLYKVADIHEVRAYVNVPQIYAARLKAGMKASLTAPQWPGRTFSATIATTSDAIGSQSGSLLVELDRPNEDRSLLPGSYVDIHFEVPMDPGQFLLASSALLFDEHGTRVAIIDAENRVRFKKVVIAEDLGTEEIIDPGLSSEDRVIDHPPDTLVDGEQVRIGSGDRAKAGK